MRQALRTDPQWRPQWLDNPPVQIPMASYDCVIPGPAGAFAQFYQQGRLLCLNA